jgi:hypothetical protein
MAYILGSPIGIYTGGWNGQTGTDVPNWNLPWDSWWLNVDLASSGIGSNIHYAIEIFTETTENDASIGLIDGVFRYITGRPNYSGAPPYPSWGPDEWNSYQTYNSYAWYEGFLTKDGMSNPSRTINIDKTGDYGTLSSFSCSLRNNDLIWTYFRNDDVASNLNLLNKEIRVYAVLDAVFYQIWGGVITDTPRNEKEFIINCSDYPSKFHKEIPANAVLGSPDYVEAMNTSSGELIYLNLNTPDAAIYEAGIATPSWSEIPVIYYDLMTNLTIFDANELAGKYLYIDNWNTDPGFSTTIDNSNGLFIIANDATQESQTLPISGSPFTTICDVTRVYTSRLFKSDPPFTDIDDFNDSFIYRTCIGVQSFGREIAYAKCVSLGSIYKVASSGITIDTSAIYSYDSDSNTYNPINVAWEDIGSGYIKIIDTRFGDLEDESLVYYKKNNMRINSVIVEGYDDPVSPIRQFIATITDQAQLALLTDGDQTTGITIPESSGETIQRLKFIFNISFPTKPLDEDIYILPDIQISDTNGIIPVNDIVITYRGLDPYSNTVNLNNFYYEPPNRPISYDITGNTDQWENLFLIPDDYYASGKRITDSGVYNKRTLSPFNDQYITYSTYDTSGSGWFSDQTKLINKAESFVKRRIVTNLIVEYYCNMGTMIPNVNIKLNQLAYITKSTYDFKDSLYVKTSGETIDGAATNNVYTIYKKILEDYDGIDTSYINYGNLSGSRSSWVASRQFDEAVSSKDALKELCQNSYTALFPDRLGKRTFNCWLDATGYDWDHNEDNIVRDSIAQFVYTPMRDIYSDFSLEYNWDSGSKKYTDSIIVTNTDKDSFPAQSADWTSYVAGLDSYDTASGIWSLAHSGYLITNSKQRHGDQLGKLPWFVTEVVNEGSAYKYLTNLVQWTSKQHINSDYAIPLTSGNINVNLTDAVRFNDKLYTNDRNYYGWIDKIEYDIKNDQISVGLFISPDTVKLIIIDAGICAVQEDPINPDIVIHNNIYDDFETGTVAADFDPTFKSRLDVEQWGTKYGARNVLSVFPQSILPSSMTISGDCTFIGSTISEEVLTYYDFIFCGLKTDADTGVNSSFMLTYGFDQGGSGSGVITCQYRNPTGGASTVVNGTAYIYNDAPYPVQLKLERIGEEVKAYYNLGSFWNQLGPAMTLDSSIQVNGVMLANNIAPDDNMAWDTLYFNNEYTIVGTPNPVIALDRTDYKIYDAQTNRESLIITRKQEVI